MIRARFRARFQTPGGGEARDFVPEVVRVALDFVGVGLRAGEDCAGFVGVLGTGEGCVFLGEGEGWEEEGEEGEGIHDGWWVVCFLWSAFGSGEKLL